MYDRSFTCPEAVGDTTLMEFSNVKCFREWKWKSVISKVSLVEIDLCGTVLLDAV